MSHRKCSFHKTIDTLQGKDKRGYYIHRRTQRSPLCILYIEYEPTIVDVSNTICYITLNTAWKSCRRLYVMKICVLTLNLFLQHKSCFSMGLISLDTKKIKYFFCVLIVVSENDASD